VHANPTSGLSVPAVNRRQTKFATVEQLDAMLSGLPVAKDRAIWATALYAGLRRGELMALHREDVDLAYLIAGPRGGRIFIGVRDGYDRGRQAAENAGVEPPTLHECRHGYAALMRVGVNIKALSTFMGHANIGITLDQ
jgi:integrase